jgi:hypothetical protein
MLKCITNPFSGVGVPAAAKKLVGMGAAYPQVSDAWPGPHWPLEPSGHKP